ncbi:glycoside hydrolase family 127 protein [Fibrella aquatilis]|uniref:Glycoside hydrolase family 127 protein n=1 Tax=Fibrella aquatilis TaxID=2817059 RepID=A0A939G4X9_9BACT|nr:beta-L-arabinofuranosidase domain-containing protein [Fibrella aquatilis]MBO0931966.1 glycoside hydrolase family 127 protein [Fibrella aquatilis]
MNRILILFYLLLPLPVLAQSLPIEGSWQFTTGDNPAWAAPGFDDTAWKSIQPTRTWEEQGFAGYDGVGWYRKRIVIPSSLKNQLERGVLVLSLGVIDDDDQTYLNGKLVGETTGYQVPRTYRLAENQIRWDAENVLAIRVADLTGGGGLYDAGGRLFRRARLTDYFAFTVKNTSAAASATDALSYRITWKNGSDEPIAGTLTTTLTDLTGRVLSRDEKPVTVAPGTPEQTQTYPRPSSLPVRVTTVFQTKQGNLPPDTLTGSTIIGSSPIVYQSPRFPLRPYKLPERFVATPYEQQQIGGWLGERMDRNLTERLLKVDETGLMAGYFNRPGEQEWIGEHVGKYLETAANTYRYSRNAALKIQMDRMAQQLIASQLPNGYLGTYTPDQYWTSWDVWSHKYNLLGLLAYYNLSGYEPALTASKKMGDLLCKTFGTGPGQLDIVVHSTHEGMAAMSVLDPMTDLYRQTGDAKYLAFCRYLIKAYDQPNGPKIIATLNSIGRVDKTANAKAYEMLSNLVGLVKYHKLTGEAAPLKAAQTAWNDITAHRLYVTGSASSFEHFQDDDKLAAEADKNIGEGCVTTTWIQFNYQLLTLTGEVKYLNQLEKSAYNHLTGAENPETGCVSYYTPLLGKKPYNCGITCCTSSVPRGIALIPTFSSGQLSGSPVVMLYQAGTINSTLNGQPITLTATTDFPASGQVVYTVKTAKPVRGGLYFRVPDWCNRKFTLNGLPVKAETGYARLDGNWKTGDRITVVMEMAVQVLPGGSSYPGRIGFRRGPQVLSLDALLNKLPVEPTAVQLTGQSLRPVQATLPTGWIGTQTYGVSATVGDRQQELVLVPYADAGQTGGASAVWLRQ